MNNTVLRYAEDECCSNSPELMMRMMVVENVQPLSHGSFLYLSSRRLPVFFILSCWPSSHCIIVFEAVQL